VPDDPYQNALARILSDPNLQTGPFPQWPTIPPMPPRRPDVFERDYTRPLNPDEPVDASGNVSPLGLAMALMGAKAGLMSRLNALPQAPRRNALPSDLTVQKFGPEERNWRVESPSGDGYVTGYQNPTNGALHIGEASLPQDQRGQGVGMAMYQRMIDAAHAEGMPVYSDRRVSSSAQAIYDGLSRRGYQVTERPGGRDVDNPGPMFTVLPKQSLGND
jgi:hypothetical protein